MDCKEIFERLGDYIDHELDPDMCDEIEKHIEDCEPCVAFINTLRKTVELFRGVGDTILDDPIPDGVSDNLKRFLADNISKTDEEGTDGK